MASNVSEENMRGAGALAALKVGMDGLFSPLQMKNSVGLEACVLLPSWDVFYAGYTGPWLNAMCLSEAHVASSWRLLRSSAPCARRQLGSVQFPVSWNFLQRRSSGPPLRRLCLTAALGAASGILPLETARGTTAPPTLASLRENVPKSQCYAAVHSNSRGRQARRTVFALPSVLQACSAQPYCLENNLADLGKRACLDSSSPCGAPDIPRFCCLCREYALSVFTLDASGDKIGRGVHIDQLRAVMSKMALISKGTLTSLLHGQTCRVTHSTSDVAQLSTRNGHFWQETHLICDAILSLVANQWQLIRLIMVIGAMQAFAVGL